MQHTCSLNPLECLYAIKIPKIKIFRENMDASMYVETLRRSLMPCIRSHPGIAWKIHQDNARASAICRSYLHRNGVSWVSLKKSTALNRVDRINLSILALSI